MGADENLRAGVIVAGRYRIERALGEGGMSTVYAVRHVHTGERLALKLLRASRASGDPRAAELFRREMQAPARIGSEHVVRVTDADVAPELGDAPFLVMELLRGRDLEREVAARGALPAPEVLLYLGQAARALDKAHKIGIVHRDLKPENLFLSRREDGTPWIKILDFGIAKVAPGGAEELGPVTTTAAGEVFGTPLYMSPDQARGLNDRVGPPTDIWALGVIAHKLLTAQDAWAPRSLAHLVSLVAFEPVVPPSERGSGLGGGFDAWFLQCCAREIERRFPTAGEAVAALGEALGAAAADPASLAKLEPAEDPPPDPPSGPPTLEPEREQAPREGGELGSSSATMSRTRMAPAARSRAGWAAGVASVLALVAAAALFGLRARSSLPPAAAAVAARSSPPPAAADAPLPPADAPPPPAGAPPPPGGAKLGTRAPRPPGNKTKPKGDPMLDVRD
ncbi:MAG: serine/threonine protein kinase [Polyangiaceae bacterium]|nr:serine/threonine protein kinase [Polyangiaceae bacterium]